MNLTDTVLKGAKQLQDQIPAIVAKHWQAPLRFSPHRMIGETALVFLFEGQDRSSRIVGVYSTGVNATFRSALPFDTFAPLTKVTALLPTNSDFVEWQNASFIGHHWITEGDRISTEALLKDLAALQRQHIDLIKQIEATQP